MTVSKNDDNGRRIVLFGSKLWTSRALTVAAFNRIMQVYRPPYTLVCDMTDGAARFAAATAHSLGWQVEVHEFDPTKCGPDCATSGHRRSGGPHGDYCPTAKARNVDRMVDLGTDLVVVLSHGTPIAGATGRDSTKEIKMRGVGLWEFTQPVARKGSK